MINGARGLLPLLRGLEAYLSVGTGHFTGWVRAIKFGCRTPYKSMQDSQGNLSADRFRKKDKRMGKCLDEGYEWRVFPWQCEVAWPRLPDLAQRALNASHGVTSRSTEAEVMVWVAEAEKDKDDQTTLAQITEMLADSSPPCASYIGIVGQLAVQVSGGASAPMLHLMDRVPKLYDENETLGEDMCTAVVQLSVSKTDMLCFVKAGLCITNLCAEKVTDDIARLLTKSDVERLKNKDKKDMVLAAEKAMSECADIAAANLLSQAIKQTQYDQILAQFFTRVILFICDKQKQGPEKRVFESMDKIKEAMIESVIKDATGIVDVTPWAMPEFAPAGARGEAVVNPRPIHEIQNPLTIFRDHGFSLGSIVKEKGVDARDFYTITGSGATVSLKRIHTFGEGEPNTIDFTVEVFFGQLVSTFRRRPYRDRWARR